MQRSSISDIRLGARCARTHRSFPPALATELNALQRSSGDELHRAAEAANALMDCCAFAVSEVIAAAQVTASDVAAIGVHGQTIRHRPDIGYTIQLANPARLVEATGIAVVADFRSRDVAAGGQGAPLAPALHAALFGSRQSIESSSISAVSPISPTYLRTARFAGSIPALAIHCWTHGACGTRVSTSIATAPGARAAESTWHCWQRCARILISRAAAQEHRARPLQSAVAGTARDSRVSACRRPADTDGIDLLDGRRCDRCILPPARPRCWPAAAARATAP